MFGGGEARLQIHAHIQRTGVPEGKSALAGVELHAGNAQVGQHAIERRPIHLPGQFVYS